jgi:hypothetical protein
LIGRSERTLPIGPIPEQTGTGKRHIREALTSARSTPFVPRWIAWGSDGRLSSESEEETEVTLLTREGWVTVEAPLRPWMVERDNLHAQARKQHRPPSIQELWEVAPNYVEEITGNRPATRRELTEMSQSAAAIASEVGVMDEMRGTNQYDMRPSSYPGIGEEMRSAGASIPRPKSMMAPEEMYKHLSLAIETSMKEREHLSETATVLEGQLAGTRSLEASLTRNIEVMTKAQDQIATLLPDKMNPETRDAPSSRWETRDAVGFSRG